MKRLLPFFCLALLAGTPATAQQTSAYTKFNILKCPQIEKADHQVFAGTWRCPGFGGYSVFISEADLRQMAGFGKSKARACALGKTFLGFNSAGNTIEWRLRQGVPFAAIQRWTVSGAADIPEKRATWLVVSKLNGDASCPLRYIAGAYPNANTMARKVADEKAAAFNCNKDQPGVDPATMTPGISLEPCSE